MQTNVYSLERRKQEIGLHRRGGIATIQPTLFPYSRPKANQANAVSEKSGVVYTKPWVIDLILDLVGYTVNRRLFDFLLVEPAAGDGSFLKRVAERLVASCILHGLPFSACLQSVIAFEVDDESAARARAEVIAVLKGHGVDQLDAATVAGNWIRTADYLMETSELVGTADFVIGNPPYIRLEDLNGLGDVYRASYPTMVGRADIYVAFYEAALRHLKPGGTCGFICADRWMFNQYGAELRAFVTGAFSVEAVIQMHHADAFEREVSAYPAVTIIRSAPQGPVLVATLEPEAESIGASALAEDFRDGRNGKRLTNAAHIDRWFTGSSPWPLMAPEKLALLRRLESEFPGIEDTGATVGIGVATGADKIFITRNPELVEADRLLPLAMAFDVKGSNLERPTHFLVNPWDSNGLVELSKFPKLAAYLGQHRDQLRGRHVGQKVPKNWYRTIDRVNEQLTRRAKLYLPDIKGRLAPVIDRGETYPHHNLYFITAERWEPEVLGGLLLSTVCQFFIEAYGVRMRGGYLRFQAQYLRRIRVPHPSEVSVDQSKRLKTAFEIHDVAAANSVAGELYALSELERKLLES